MDAAPASKKRILVVDDSALIRRVITMALAADDRFEVTTAVNGQRALDVLDRVRPDAMTLDVEMPELDGLGTLRALRERRRRLPIVMFSTLTERGAATTIEALTLGASDYVTKPTGTGSLEVSMQRVRAELLPKLHALLRMDAPGSAPKVSAPAPPVRVSMPPRTHLHRATEVVVVGVSTGGPSTLETFLSALPATLPAPLVIVQHMPEHFTRQLAQRLDRHCALDVREAEDGAEIARGQVWIARGGRHCELRRDGSHLRLRLHDGPSVQFCRPSVDVLFDSAAHACPGSALALVLTGMGRDGARGAVTLRQAGCDVFAQDEASSVVYGMPRAVVEAGAATASIALEDLAPRLVRYLTPHRASAFPATAV